MYCLYTELKLSMISTFHDVNHQGKLQTGACVNDDCTVPVIVEDKDRNIEQQCPPETSHSQKKYYNEMNDIFRDD